MTPNLAPDERVIASFNPDIHVTVTERGSRADGDHEINVYIEDDTDGFGKSERDKKLVLDLNSEAGDPTGGLYNILADHGLAEADAAAKEASR